MKKGPLTERGVITKGVKVGGSVWLGRRVGVVDGIRDGVPLALRVRVMLGWGGLLPCEKRPKDDAPSAWLCAAQAGSVESIRMPTRIEIKGLRPR